jgi:hypothetical protein
VVTPDNPDVLRRLSAEAWAQAVRTSGYVARIAEALEGYIPPIPVPDWTEAGRANQELRGRSRGKKVCLRVANWIDRHRLRH